MSVFSFLLCLVAGSVFSCSDINTDAYIFASTSTLINSGTKNVRLLVSSNANLLSSSASRTIAPAAYDSAQLNFYLGGKNVGTGANLTIQQVDFVASEDSPSSGTIIVPLNSYNYQLVLLAVPKSTEVTISSNTYASSLAPLAVLAGTATADLRYNNDSEVNFYLSSNGLTGNGGYDIQFYLKNWSAASLNATDSENSDIRVVGNVSLELRTLSGDASVSGTEITGKSFASATSAVSAVSVLSDVSVASDVSAVDLLWLTRGFRGTDLRVLSALYRPRLVVLDASLPLCQRAALAAEANALGWAVYDVSVQGALKLKFGSAR